MGAHVRLVQHARLDHGLQHPSQGSTPRLNVRNVHDAQIAPLVEARSSPLNLVHGDVGGAEIIEHALFRFPHLHEHLAEVEVLEKQTQLRWKLFVRHEQVFLRCVAQAGQDLKDEVLYIDSALVGGWILPMPPIEKSEQAPQNRLRVSGSSALRLILGSSVELKYLEDTMSKNSTPMQPFAAMRALYVSGKKMAATLGASAPRQKFGQWCRDDEVVPTQSILLVRGVPIRLCQSAAPIGITLQSELVLTAIAVVIATLILAITAALLVLRSWTIWQRRCRWWPVAGTKGRARLTQADLVASEVALRPPMVREHGLLP